MTLNADSIVLAGAVLSAVLAMGGVAVGVLKWVLNQNKQTLEIANLRALHEKDMREFRAQEQAEIQAIREELCVLSYAMLASLDGLRQLHCNGEVTRAHEKLEKHLNQQAHRTN